MPYSYIKFRKSLGSTVHRQKLTRTITVLF